MAWPFFRRSRPIWRGVPLGFDRNGVPIDYSKADDGGGNAPTLVFGPPGSFKTVGLVATALLADTSKRSYVVIDPKGEICAVTSKFRRRVSDVKIINPYGLLVKERPDMKSHGWNPLNDLTPYEIDPATGDKRPALAFGDDCQAKGDAMIKTGSNEHQPHFPDSARSGVTATIIYEVRDADAQDIPRSLPQVRGVLTQEAEKLKASIKEMVDSGDFDISTRAAKFLNATNEIESIKSTIETQTAWMTKPLRDDMTTKEGVDFRDCTKRPTTIYVIIPTTELQAKATYLRLVLSSALRALYRHGGIPTTLLIEEAFVLGYHAEIEQALSILRGYGSRMTVVFQSLQQIRKLYPDTWGLFTAGAVLAFRPADTDTAQWLVQKSGKVTVPVKGATEPRPGELMPGSGWQQRERERIPLFKMFGMPRGRALVWKPGDDAPRIAHVKGYFELRKLARRASPNPYFTGVKARPGALRQWAKAAIAVTVASVVIGAVLLHRPDVRAWLSWNTGPVLHQVPQRGPVQHHARR
jgi:type IV secretion system protein VirD4